MNKEYLSLKEISPNNALSKISLKSNNTKAELKFKYLIYKLEMASYHQKFL